MTDLYGREADAIADGLTNDPDLFTPVSAEFAQASDAGYGHWSAPEEGSGSDPDAHDYAAGDRSTRALSDVERSDLDELGRVMSGVGQPLLSANGRGAYVDPGEDIYTVTTDSVPVASTGTDLAAAVTKETKPWRQFGRLDWSSRSHRYGLFVAAALVIVVVVSLTLPWGEDTSHNSTSASTPGFSVPTVTQSSAAPSPPTVAGPASPGGDGPIRIKSVQSRCTAGSTDPKQAFDGDPNSAWMCVPAYGAPGTVLRVEFDNWYIVTGVTIVPGWNRINADGSDEWIKHMTAETVEYQFNDADETRFTQPTKSVRDEVVTPIQPPVLASAMTITITEFGKPTGPVADTTTVPGQGGIIASDKPVTGDLKDFAISSISVIGHRAA